jgi:glycosyltransferase involved in cell wall biosynthesis
MKIGILIVFRNNEKEIEISQFIRLFTKKKHQEICFVNNGSTDQTLKILKEIKEEVTIPISIVDVKKDRGHNAAVKAGIRYLSNKNDLPYLLCKQHFKSYGFEMLEKEL